ncbi:class I SAM-dependent methyltransferase [Jeotgalibacillus terrae]|uniref:Class I SAM-dependent methyltransferase n=1 Tax=Jeotgalibacillus terrae TaxID=587735 RepID=A0ABW5ZLX1_9BACL|nr:16S rRNA G966 N2-methylase RsmD [Jeotgalibacillus terrae]
MIITTSGRPGAGSFSNLKIASEYFSDAQVVDRNKRSISSLQEVYRDDILIAGDKRFEYFSADVEKPFFYHPNSASFRIKRMMNGETDPLIQAADLSSDDLFLDCTAGMASDALVASWYCNQPATAIEARKEIAFITGQGLKTFTHRSEDINRAMRQIKLFHADAFTFLQSCPDNSYDVVYFDPMFTETIESEGISPLKKLAYIQDENLSNAINEAKRVSRKKVMLKDHFRSHRFSAFGFTQLIRQSTKQHYGIINKG